MRRIADRDCNECFSKSCECDCKMCWSVRERNNSLTQKELNQLCMKLVPKDKE